MTSTHNSLLVRKWVGNCLFHPSLPIPFRNILDLITFLVSYYWLKLDILCPNLIPPLHYCYIPLNLGPRTTVDFPTWCRTFDDPLVTSKTLHFHTLVQHKIFVLRSYPTSPFSTQSLWIPFDSVIRSYSLLPQVSRRRPLTPTVTLPRRSFVLVDRSPVYFILYLPSRISPKGRTRWPSSLS